MDKFVLDDKIEKPLKEYIETVARFGDTLKKGLVKTAETYADEHRRRVFFESALFWIGAYYGKEATWVISSDELEEMIEKNARVKVNVQVYKTDAGEMIVKVENEEIPENVETFE